MSEDQGDVSRFEELLPWYTSGSLSDEDRIWMDHFLATSPNAAAALARERALADSFARSLAAVGEDVGLIKSLSMIATEQAEISRSLPQPNRLTQWVVGFVQSLGQPRFAAAMLAVIAVQAGIISWQLSPDPDTDRFRSTPVHELRTLRVTFTQDLTEAQLRAALISAGARIVGGPSQLGEYWLASGILSLEEMRSSLSEAGVVTSAEIDPNGPGHQ